MPSAILSSDIGTSSLKAAFIDPGGNLLAFSRASYPAGAHAAVWEEAFAGALEKLRAQAPGCLIDGICFSGNGPTLVPVSLEGQALPPLYWNDGRILLPPVGGLSFFLPHVAWFKENEPTKYEKLGFFVSSHEWLASRIGAEVVTVLPQSSYKPWYWDDEQCDLFGLDIKKFPPFVKMGSLIGRVSAEAARRFPALKSGTPIISGGPDFITALIGTGTLKTGDVCDRAGSSEGINVCAGEKGASSVRAADGMGLRVLPHVKAGFWNIGALIPMSGRLFDWYRSFTGQEGRSYEELLTELIPSDKGTEIFEGRFFFPGEQDFPDNTSLGRAVLCAIAFAVRGAVELLDGWGFPVRKMMVSGGQGKNPRWNQLKADITGVTIMVPEIQDGELAGNAVLSALALDSSAGREGHLDSIAARMIRVREVYEPKSENALFWEERYTQYRKLLESAPEGNKA